MIPSVEPALPRRSVRRAAARALALAAATVPAGCGPAGDAREGAPPPAPFLAAPAATAAPPWWRGAVAVSVAGDAPGTRDILLVPLAGGTPRRLVGGLEEVGRLAWSPDGAWLAFGARRDGNVDLFRVRADGTGLERLTDDPAFDGGPAWSPDGRALAFESARAGGLAIYRLDLGPGEGGAGAADDPAGAAAPPPPRPLAEADGPAIEPAWSPDGARVAYAAWREGRYAIEAVPAEGGAPVTLVAGADADAQAPAWSADGRRLAWVERDLGRATLRHAPWRDGVLGPARALAAAGVDAFAPSPTGGAVATLRRDRRSSVLAAYDLTGPARATLATLGPDAGPIAWTGAPPAGALAPAEPAPALGAAPLEPARPATAAARPGLVALEGVSTPGPRINAALADDFGALRAEVRAATGHDFLGRLSDAWRPLGFQSSGSAFFSWHKTGRAFDTPMELAAAGANGMVLVREDVDGRTYWRMHLRAGAQDGSVGAPLRAAGWSLYARVSGDVAADRAGGARQARIPSGYYLDFTALAARHGWRRIPSISRPGFDWRHDWAAIEFWHFERRDGLTWFEAARQVYGDEELAAVLDPDALRARGVSGRSRGWVGIPPGWAPEG